MNKAGTSELSLLTEPLMAGLAGSGHVPESLIEAGNLPISGEFHKSFGYVFMASGGIAKPLKILPDRIGGLGGCTATTLRKIFWYACGPGADFISKRNDRFGIAIPYQPADSLQVVLAFLEIIHPFLDNAGCTFMSLGNTTDRDPGYKREDQSKEDKPMMCPM